LLIRKKNLINIELEPNKEWGKREFGWMSD